MSDRGFILQPTYRIAAGRPVVHLYGKLANGETFLLRDDREVPHFYVRAADVERARRFYEGVFGWRFEAWGPPGFYNIDIDDRFNAVSTLSVSTDPGAGSSALPM